MCHKVKPFITHYILTPHQSHYFSPLLSNIIPCGYSSLSAEQTRYVNVELLFSDSTSKTMKVELKCSKIREFLFIPCYSVGFRNIILRKVETYSK
jgi:hypothetical protein